MTPAEIDALPAGYELDALVAEKVMGWTERDSRGPGGHPMRRWFPPQNGPWEWDQDEPKPYSTDIAAAWEVVEKLATDGWFQILCNPNGPDGKQVWRVELDPPSQSGERLHARVLEGTDRSYGDTAPVAICRAGLKALLP